MAGRPRTRARQAEQQAALISDQRASLPQAHETPASYTNDLIPELLDLADQGYAVAEVAAHWAISEETLKEWANTHSDLAEAISRARAREKAWWLAKAREAIRDNNNKFPAGAWSHVMRAKFPEYADHSGVIVNVNLSDLVVIQRRQPPEPLQERVAGADRSLIEGRAVRLPHSQTVSDGAEGGTEPTHHDGPAAGRLLHQDDR